MNGSTRSRPVGHIPGLDGIRALAIAGVLLSHSVIFDEFTALRPVGLSAGQAGVTVFFVLSGYLITSLLLREEERTGGISLRNFYARRALRLFPALWLYLLTVWVIWKAGSLPHHPWYSFITSLFYVRNLVGRGHETDHLWSLSIEEQFYVFWPLVFVLLPGRNRARLAIALTTLTAVTAWRAYAALHGLVSTGALYIRTDFRFDGPLFGCALALMTRVLPPAVTRLNETGARSAVLALLGAGGLAAYAALGIDRMVPPGTDITVICLLALILILSQTGAQSAGSRWLAWGPLVFVGQLSYGVYLWQQLFMGHPAPGFERLRSFPVGLGATFAAAALSYYLLERPLLRLKDRWFHGGGVANEPPAPGARHA